MSHPLLFGFFVFFKKIVETIIAHKKHLLRSPSNISNETFENAECPKRDSIATPCKNPKRKAKLPKKR